MPETLFQELKRYVGFGLEDEAALRALHPLAAPHFRGVAEVFYARVLTHDEATRALKGGESTVGRLKGTLVEWMDKLLTGPWDEAYFDLRCRIGRMHVRIALPQHYMFGAMNVLRRELEAVIDLAPPEDQRRMRVALGRILDLELAIMLHTYREDMLAQQSRAERLATFGQLVGSIGHELRNPLGVMESSLYILQSRVPNDERAQKHIARIAEQVGISNQIITSLLDMIRDRPLEREPLALDRLIAEAATAVRRPEEVRLELRDLAGLSLRGDPVQLKQVYVNLLENAVHAASPQGEVRVRALSSPDAIEVRVEDTGAGVEPAVLHRLFEPLITTKAKGIGLGLALVKRMVERHGGTIRYEPLPGRGASFITRFPKP
jgi:signal transduction histidine kinase